MRAAMVRRWIGAQPVPFIVVLGVIAVLAGAYIAIYSGVDPPDTEPAKGWRLVASVIPGAIVVLMAYLIANFLLFAHRLASVEDLVDRLTKRVLGGLETPTAGLKDVYQGHWWVPWEDLIANAEEITLVARYWDDRATDLRRCLSEFFQRGGQFNLFISDYEDDATLDIAARERERAYGPHPSQMRWRILRTLCELAAARENARERAGKTGGPPVRAAQLSARSVKSAFNYTLMEIDKSRVLLTVNEHCFAPEDPPPILQLDVATTPGLRDFIDAEIRGFKRKQQSHKASLPKVRKEYLKIRKEREKL